MFERVRQVAHKSKQIPMFWAGERGSVGDPALAAAKRWRSHRPSHSTRGKLGA